MVTAANSQPGLPAALVRELRRVVGDDGVLDRPAALTPYECDAYTLERAVPAAVVLPRSTDETRRVVELLHAAGRSFVPRGAGTSLAGGTSVPAGAVLVGLARMRHLLHLDPAERTARVEAGLVNVHLTRAAAPHGLHYAPDPSSQSACTIGGNVATNSGGPHTLKYGVTTNHVLGVTLVLPDGEVLELGGTLPEVAGYDLAGLVVGHEGTFGIVTEVTVRLERDAEAARTFLAVFDSVSVACRTISSIIAHGIVPAALEMLDRDILQAVEDAFELGLPRDAEAVLLIEIDGLAAGLDDHGNRIQSLCREHGCRSIRAARDEVERRDLWIARKRAFGAIGRLAPSYCTQDGVVPRTKLPEILDRIRSIGQRHGLAIPNVFHAGDGNVHPILLYDERHPEQVEAVLAASTEILQACLDLGGSVSGEHGVGIEKLAMLERMFSSDDLDCMRRVRDAFNPDGLCNPGKVLATGAGSCVEGVRPVRRQAAV